jgi:hypothetical protein
MRLAHPTLYPEEHSKCGRRDDAGGFRVAMLHHLAEVNCVLTLTDYQEFDSRGNRPMAEATRPLIPVGGIVKIRDKAGGERHA